MKKANILCVVLAVVFSGCVAKNGNVGVSNVASTNKPASVDQTYSTERINSAQQTKSAQLSEVPSMPTSGGGGGGRLNQVAQTQVSLNQVQSSENQPVPVARKIIRNADLQLETDKPEEAQQKITSIAESKGGFVVESTQSSSDARAATRDTVTMTVRVPAEKFNEALEEIRKTASRVRVETVKSDDVTEEFIDIEAQLKAKKALEAQFLEIMKRANTVDDALNVQSQLADVRGEIEKIEGRKRFLENQAALSTVKIRLQTPTALTTNSEGFGYRLKDAFGSGLEAALNFILGLVSFAIAILPFFIFIVLPVYLVIRHFLKKRQKEKTASQIVKEELKEE